jgi:hypothetical protein
MRFLVDNALSPVLLEHCSRVCPNSSLDFDWWKPMTKEEVDASLAGR